jgi:selenocysteine-specific elongation factor
MYIVGTSGHIDHGKTSLILALSGTDCDRLPEEKSRGMTIDIGFASIEYPRFGTVSIIDVPGHERFIRNMVVGAWGIDLALLVVAVDDGWMPQTEDHFRVLQLLGIQRMIIVLNKIDAVDSDMTELVKEQVIEKTAGTRFEGSDILKVSSKTGDGIPELREAIVANLRKLAKISDSKKPYLFIDRVFASKGYGTVITGTLKNGIFHDNDSVILLPGASEARIKRIESHYSVLQEGSPSQRTALNLSGVQTDSLSRGDIVCAENFFTESSDAIVSIQVLDKKKKLKNNHGIEILIGTNAVKGKIILLSDDDTEKNSIVCRIKFDAKWYFYPGQPFIAANPGGFRILGGGIILLPEFNPIEHKSFVKKSVSSLKTFSDEEILLFIISVSKSLKAENLVKMFPRNDKNTERLIDLLIQTGKITVHSGYVFTIEFFNETALKIKETIKNNIGMNLKEIADIAVISTEVCRLMLTVIMKDEAIIEKDGRFFSGAAVTIDTLTPSKKKILDEIYKNAGEGIELEKLKDDIAKKDIKDLIKLNFIISLDGNILFHKEIYEKMKIDIMDLFKTREKITMAEAKDAVNLSRKYIIPLLNRIETDGLLKRIGDFRIKAK